MSDVYAKLIRDFRPRGTAVLPRMSMTTHCGELYINSGVPSRLVIQHKLQKNLYAIYEFDGNHYPTEDEFGGWFLTYNFKGTELQLQHASITPVDGRQGW